MSVRTKTSAICAALLTGALGLWGLPAHAETMNVGTHELLAQPGQQIELFATGTEQVAGLEFDIQLGDGGSDLGGSDIPGVTVPQITDIDLITGTIFELGTNPSQLDVVTFPLARQSTVDIEDTVTADGKIAKVTFDASGIPPGTEVPLTLWGVAGTSDTHFYDAQASTVPITGQPGTIRIVPEPSTVLLLVVFLGGCAVVCRRLRSAKP